MVITSPGEAGAQCHRELSWAQLPVVKWQDGRGGAAPTRVMNEVSAGVRFYICNVLAFGVDCIFSYETNRF